ncbi:DUF4097 domain-containing protein [Micromonospora sp. DR5-3]|uniref:DUF4097 family beta strand repeat-containing protein n=1 Tax=unclassified Micromonospora TaxID=2617518 RepID=UPI0011D679A7|nr:MULTISPECIES: DUF4097 family beta strand repeat-containing protein [unclassified Micromonospora]MCW3816781.1 DUF4097 domain-containing protein [Micromonospora sp. DR5-3]TYC23689.1 DUF4097 domain-containing protein [Micromonospora sp. MP36]
MAVHRTVAAAAAASLILLCGCDTISFRRLDYDNTEAVKITRITVEPGAGNVTVRAAGSAAQVRIKRTVRYQGGQPDTRYEINGDELVLRTDCGPRCSISWEVSAPEGVAVRGETDSGDVEMSQVGAVEFKLGSGNVSVSGAHGDVRAETGSGNIDVVDAAGAVRLRATSGDITAQRLAAGVDAETTSGNVTVELATPASARVHAGSGDVELAVPDGRYRVRGSTGSGDRDLGVTDDPAAALVLDVSTGSGNVTITRR